MKGAVVANLRILTLTKDTDHVVLCHPQEDPL